MKAMTGLLEETPLRHGLPTVKICGITLQETLDAIEALSQPPEYIGFVFAPSRREVTPDVFSTFRLGTLKSRKVGVFVQPSLERIDKVLEHGELDVIQLSGDEPESFVRAVRERYRLPVIKTYRPEALTPGRASEPSSTSSNQSLFPESDVVLLDTSLPGHYGGTGKTFDWMHIERWRALTIRLEKPLWVAGGITPDNVSMLLSRYDVDGVDVSSGVETDGKKDIQKIKTLLSVVRSVRRLHR
ncbi:MAG: Phosphoribosylanthranilate isomerase [Candidatus Carbobacillus altaicus]|uniref:N-(5'-phosphoribosyl)anthranilate isomerase n=1 Tax=Candidatus Carbonibacillus altaicus TaxID=2163959 RepID=A0A2R6Y1Q7_9BACL|nr:MAG: Phosphoribosylanthranilate isomerase [Candidatus Carbobacillus altaicus]